MLEKRVFGQAALHHKGQIAAAGQDDRRQGEGLQSAHVVADEHTRLVERVEMGQPFDMEPATGRFQAADHLFAGTGPRELVVAPQAGQAAAAQDDADHLRVKQRRGEGACQPAGGPFGGIIAVSVKPPACVRDHGQPSPIVMNRLADGGSGTGAGRRPCRPRPPRRAWSGRAIGQYTLKGASRQSTRHRCRR